MLNKIWIGLMLIAVAGSFFTGETAAVTEALLNGGKNTLTFMLTLGGSMCLWSGLLRVADKAGFTRLFARLTAPLMHRLFPDLPSEGEACRAMSMNMAANVMGLGNAATPLGISAMKEMNKKNKKNSIRKDEVLVVPPYFVSKTYLYTITRHRIYLIHKSQLESDLSIIS